MANLYSADFENAVEKQSERIMNSLGINGGACTFAFWAKFESFNTGTAMDLFGQSNTTSKTRFSIRADESAGNVNILFRRVKVGTNGTTITATNANPGTANWHHYAFTYDNTNINGYIDGALVAGPTAASGDGITTATTFFVIATSDDSEGGTFASNTLGRHFDGLMDDFIVFNVDIGATRVSNLYTTPCSPDLTNAVARYELENNYNDTIGTFHLDTAEGSPVFSATVPYTCAGVAVTPSHNLLLLGIG